MSKSRNSFYTHIFMANILIYYLCRTLSLMAFSLTKAVAVHDKTSKAHLSMNICIFNKALFQHRVLMSLQHKTCRYPLYSYNLHRITDLLMWRRVRMCFYVSPIEIYMGSIDYSSALETVFSSKRLRSSKLWANV